MKKTLEGTLGGPMVGGRIKKTAIVVDGQEMAVADFEKADGLSVGGSLDLSDTTVEMLPGNLSVGGTLDLWNTSVATLPASLSVGGDLNLSSTAVEALPENLRVVGNLNLRETSIWTLPGGLSVGGTLDLSRTAIRDLPGDLSVRGGLLLNSEYGWELATAFLKLEASRAEGGSAVALEMAASLKICLGYLDEELEIITGHARLGEERMRGFRRRNAENLEAILKPVRAALDGATVETPPEGGSAVVWEMAAALKICRSYLNDRSRIERSLEDSCRYRYEEPGFHAWNAERIHAILEPVHAALDGATVETPPEDGYVASEMAEALKICRRYLREQSGEAWGDDVTCDEEYEVYGLDVACIDAILEPVCDALGGVNAFTPPEGGYVVPEMAAALKICRRYLREGPRLVWGTDEALIPVCNALDRYMADPGPERETGPAATKKKARGRSMDGGMTP